MKFGAELSDMHQVSDVAVSFTNGLREPRDVDVGSGDGGDQVDSTIPPSESPDISGCPIATAATILICTVFFL